MNVEDWLIRDRHAVGEAAPLEPRHASPGETLGEFIEQPRLADARLPDDFDHLPLASLGDAHEVVKRRELGVAPNEGAEGAPFAARERRPTRACADDA